MKPPDAPFNFEYLFEHTPQNEGWILLLIKDVAGYEETIDEMRRSVRSRPHLSAEWRSIMIEAIEESIANHYMPVLTRKRAELAEAEAMGRMMAL